MQTNILALTPAITGLPSPLSLSVGANGAILPEFGTGVTTTEPVDVRYADDLRAVLWQPEAIQQGDVLYTVQRGVTPDAIASEMERHGLCYALTILRSGTVRQSQEWVRNRGHTNSKAPGTSLPYPEIHELIQGEAWLYLQHGTTDHPTEVVVMPLFAGDKAVVAPGWASVLVNVGAMPLVIGTWRMDDCRTENAELITHGGMAHFTLRNEQGEPFCQPNARYKTAVSPRRSVPKELPDFGLTRAEPLLAAFHRSPEYLRCLLRPQDFADVWKVLYD